MHRPARQSPPGDGGIAMWDAWGDEPPVSRVPDRGDGGDGRPSAGLALGAIIGVIGWALVLMYVI